MPYNACDDYDEDATREAAERGLDAAVDEMYAAACPGCGELDCAGPGDCVCAGGCAFPVCDRCQREVESQAAAEAAMYADGELPF